MRINTKLKTAILEHEPRIYQWQLALKIKKSPQWLSLLVQNRVRPSQDIQDQISKVLRKNARDLF